MSDIKTTIQEIKKESENVILKTDATYDEYKSDSIGNKNIYDTIKLLQKKIDELTRELNTIKSALTGE